MPHTLKQVDLESFSSQRNWSHVPFAENAIFRPSKIYPLSVDMLLSHLNLSRFLSKTDQKHLVMGWTLGSQLEKCEIKC